MSLHVRVEKRLGERKIDANFEMAGATRVLALFGPSGAGKTTLLRAIAGLERPDRGQIQFANETWFDSDARRELRPQQRRVGFLFQESALFPHLTARENIQFAQPALDHALTEMLGIERLLDRYPRQLSAGERQRVALARALAPRPRLLLLDEPFSALDQPTRERLRGELKRVLEEAKIPAVLVTHDRAEAYALADHLALLCEGEILQTGSVEEVFARPRDLRAARAVGIETFVPGRILGDLATLGCIRGEDLVVTHDDAAGESASSGSRSPRDVGGAKWAGRVIAKAPEGAVVRTEIDCDFPLTALLAKHEAEKLRVGDAVNVSARQIHRIPARSEE